MPVHVTTLSLPRSAISRGAMPPLTSSPIHLGLTPSFVTPSRSATFISIRASGWNGLPSYMTVRPPNIRMNTLATYMIHPTVVYCIVTSPGPRPSCSPPSLK